jgi:hypothetical protein
LHGRINSREFAFAPAASPGLARFSRFQSQLAVLQVRMFFQVRVDDLLEGESRMFPKARR